jgi:hypothetical protein
LIIQGILWITYPKSAIEPIILYLPINLAYQIHESDPQRPIYPIPIGPNATDEKEQNDYDEGDDVRNKDNDVLEEEEQNDDGEGDDDFVPILIDGCDIGEDY